MSNGGGARRKRKGFAGFMEAHNERVNATVGAAPEDLERGLGRIVIGDFLAPMFGAWQGVARRHNMGLGPAYGHVVPRLPYVDGPWISRAIRNPQSLMSELRGVKGAHDVIERLGSLSSIDYVTASEPLSLPTVGLKVRATEEPNTLILGVALEDKSSEFYVEGGVLKGEYGQLKRSLGLQPVPRLSEDPVLPVGFLTGRVSLPPDLRLEFEQWLPTVVELSPLKSLPQT